MFDRNDDAPKMVLELDTLDAATLTRLIDLGMESDPLTAVAATRLKASVAQGLMGVVSQISGFDVEPMIEEITEKLNKGELSVEQAQDELSRNIATELGIDPADIGAKIVDLRGDKPEESPLTEEAIDAFDVEALVSKLTEGGEA